MRQVKFAEPGRDVQLHLNRLNALRFEPDFPRSDWRQRLDDTRDLAVEEGKFIEAARLSIAGRAAQAPTDPDSFVGWFERLQHEGPGQNDPLFPWLASSCTLDEMKWFLTQEVAGEAGFDDLTAMTQLKLPVRPKLELARNYWDEMGRGNPKAMHGPLLAALAEHLRWWTGRWRRYRANGG